MDKRIESTMNELINAEIWSTNLYLSMQVYLENERLPILSAWLSSQAQDNMGKVYRMMHYICHNGGRVDIREMSGDERHWKSPLNALNDLLEHEQYMSRTVSILFTLCRHIDASAYAFAHKLYTGRIYVSTVCEELLRILAQESMRRLN